MKKAKKQKMLKYILVFSIAFIILSSSIFAKEKGYNVQQQRETLKILPQTLPYQQERRACDITDLTKRLEAQFPQESIFTIRKLDDLQRRYLIINLLNKSSEEKRWVIYDLGQDNTLGGDDKWYSAAAIGLDKGEFKGEMTFTRTYAEKLFWAVREEGAEADAVASCTLPACSDAKILFTLDSWLNDTIIEELSPSLMHNRVAFILKEQLGMFVKSCSLDKNDSDYCDRPEHQEYYKIHATGDIYSLGSLREGILIYDDRGKSFLFASSADVQGGKVLALPEGTHTESLARLAPTVPQLFLVKDEEHQQSPKKADLFFFDLTTGSLHKLDTLPTNSLHVMVVGMLQGKMYTLYRIDKENSPPKYFKKQAGQKEEIVGAGQGWFGEAKQLQNGKILAIDIYKNKIADFECVP